MNQELKRRPKAVGRRRECVSCQIQITKRDGGYCRKCLAYIQGFRFNKAAKQLFRKVDLL